MYIYIQFVWTLVSCLEDAQGFLTSDQMTQHVLRQFGFDPLMLGDGRTPWGSSDAGP